MGSRNRSAGLTPNFELRSRPDGLNEIALPANLAAADVRSWASNSIAAHRATMVAATDPAAIQKSFDDLTAKFDDAFLADTARVLIWFSGKDLLAALSDWLVARGVANPGAFRAVLRDWIIANPTRALQLLPEWDGLVQVVRA